MENIFITQIIINSIHGFSFLREEILATSLKKNRTYIILNLHQLSLEYFDFFLNCLKIFSAVPSVQIKRRIHATTKCTHSNWSLFLTQSATLSLYYPFPLKRRIYDTTQCTYSNWSLSLSLPLSQSVTLSLYLPFPLKRRIYATTQCTHSNWSLFLTLSQSVSQSVSHLIIVLPIA